jgi:hypothetical protein
VTATPPLKVANPVTVRVPPMAALFVTLNELRVAKPPRGLNGSVDYDMKCYIDFVSRAR